MKVAEHATQRYTLGAEVLPCNPSIMAAKRITESWCCGHARKSPVNHTQKQCHQVKMDTTHFIVNVVTCFKQGLMFIDRKQKECKLEKNYSHMLYSLQKCVNLYDNNLYHFVTGHYKLTLA